MRDNAREFRKTVGPRSEKTYKVLPGFDFSYVAPVNARFGFSLSGSASQSISPRDFMTNTWRGVDAPTNGGTLPDTTPDKPYLSDYLYRDGFIGRIRTSIGLTLDYKLSGNDQISFSFQRTSYQSKFDNRITTFIVNRVLPGNFTTTSTHGFAGAGEVRVTNQSRSRDGVTYMPTLVYRHNGPIWNAQAGAGYSIAIDGFHDRDKGYFSQTLARRTGVTIAFDDITYLRPERISVTDGATGAPVDFYDINTYALTAPISQKITSYDLQRSVYANLARNFNWGGRHGTIKGGIDIGSSVRDITGEGQTFTFVGADGRVSTTPVGNDDFASQFYNARIASRPAPFGFRAAPVVSHPELWKFYQSNPGHFALNENTTYVSKVNQSKRAEETVYSAYIRGDINLLEQRLKLVGGIRGEQTNVNAEGPLFDPTRNYQRDAAGNILRGSNGRALPLATDALAAARLTRIERGAHVNKEYLRLFPSINASFKVRENLMARAGYYHSIGRPNLNQYAGGITLPDTDNESSAIPTITVNNVGIKAWSAKTLKLSLEYYFPGVGLISAGGFRREFENFFGNTQFMATPEFLELYDLDAETYGNHRVSTQYNIPDTVRMDGVSLAYKQALTFLPSWARGVQVFANGNVQHASGTAKGNFTYSPRFGNWGIGLTRERYDLRINWNYRGRQRQAAVTGRSIGADT